MDTNARRLSYLTYAGIALASFSVIPLTIGLLFLTTSVHHTPVVVMDAAGMIPILAVATQAIVRSLRGTEWHSEWQSFALNTKRAAAGSAIIVLCTYLFYSATVGFLPLIMPTLVALEGPIVLVIAWRAASRFCRSVN
ncbi:hypothetical protein [Arcanobacterium canis]